jgi:hypothetical protein
VSFTAGNRIERFDPEGSERPQRGVEIRGTVGTAGRESGNGFLVRIQRVPGRTEARRGIGNRTGLANVGQGVEGVGREL